MRADDDMSWNEFCSLLSGIMPDTPLGRIVAIRAESDPKVIKEFSKDQRAIRNEWLLARNRKRKEDPEAYRAYVAKFQAWAKATFS